MEPHLEMSKGRLEIWIMLTVTNCHPLNSLIYNYLAQKMGHKLAAKESWVYSWHSLGHKIRYLRPH